MSKTGNVRVHKDTMPYIQLFARPNKVMDKNEGILDLTKQHDESIQKLIERRNYSDPDASWGSGTSDVYNAVKNTILRTLIDYKPPKMVLIALIRASQGSRTCYADNIIGTELFENAQNHEHLSKIDCPLSQRASELSYFWLDYFAEGGDRNAMEMFKLFVQLFNNETLLHEQFTIEDMLLILADNLSSLDSSDWVFMYEDEDFYFVNRDNQWWSEVNHRKIANQFMFCIHNHRLRITRRMCDLANHHRVKILDTNVQDVFKQLNYLREVGYDKPEALLVEAYNNQNNPLTTPMYAQLKANDIDEPNWLFLAEAYHVSNLYCKKYGL